MKWNLFKLAKPAQNNGTPKKKDSITDTYVLFSREYSFYPEDYFRGMLIMERKRSERSNKPFILMLINLSKLPEGAEKAVVIKNLIKAFDSSTREIDIKGWYKLNLVMGIIYSEYTGIGKAELQNKIQDCINTTLSPQQAVAIEITSLTFPEEEHIEEKEIIEKNEILYTEPEIDSRLKNFAHTFKRGIDIVASVCCILLFSPVFLLVPLAIKLSSRGPVFFKQERIGKSGRKFRLIKFRTMHVNNNLSLHKEFIKNFINGTSTSSEEETGAFKLKNDPRVTKIGRFLRKSSLDEIPQFINVLIGDMSMVGPRPAIPYEVEEYDVWHKRRVLEVKPGITGLWQVNGRSRTDFNNMVRMDIRYIEKWSPLLDIKLMLQTPLALFKGAY